MNKGLLLVISGPTGAEKDKIIASLLEKHSEIYKEVSYTTREKKEDEVEGKEFNFITNKEFFDKVDKGMFLEWAEVYDGVYYGTPKHNILRKLKEGKDVLVEVDIKGALQIKEKYNNAVLIIILPKSKESMESNILNSKKGTAEKLTRKFNSAFNCINSINSINKYNYGVVNTSIEEGVYKIENIITAERCRVDNIDSSTFLK